MGDFNYDFLNFEDCQVSEEFIVVIVSYHFLPHYLKSSMMIQLQFCNNDRELALMLLTNYSTNHTLPVSV